MRNFGIAIFLFWVFLIVSEIRCIYKAVSCNWEPVGKAEAVYTIGCFTGTAVVIAWIDIEDK